MKRSMPTSAPAASAGSPVDSSRPAAPARLDRSRWVPETRFGHWFLGTNIWSRYVVEVALRELVQLRPAAARAPRRVLDAGSGPGVSLPLLDQLFQPESILALDIDPHEVARSSRQAGRCRCPVQVRRGDATQLDLPDRSMDLILCHQLLHHLVRQEEALREFYRVLAPGGTLLVAESCREFIHTAPVRLLFRHPNETQRSAAEYQQLVRAAGFAFTPAQVRTSTPFWSRPDWGLRERLGWRRRAAEVTQLTMVALRPPEGVA
jgi:ubiquinone/menaquinone biosynthesis C-methylase UbiE